MKFLVVFDALPDCTQNWQAALAAARQARLRTKRGEPVEIRIGVLKLLPEDKPLDTHLQELERLTFCKLKLAWQAISEEKNIPVSVEVIQGMDLEAAYLVGRSAAHWGADHIFVSLGRACWTCTEHATRVPFLTRLGRRLLRWRTPDRRAPETKQDGGIGAIPTVEMNDLLNTAPCRVSVTCHSAVTVTLEMHRAYSGMPDTYAL